MEDYLREHSNSSQPARSSKKSAKALFTLSYMVAYELKKLIQMPAVKPLLDASHFSKFKLYFGQAIQALLSEEHQ